MVTWNDENVAHLLARAGFGGDANDVKRYLNYGQAIAVEKLVGVKGSGSKGPGRSGAAAADGADFLKLQTWWAKRMVKATSRRLQEKMCLFWHDHFATSFDVVKNNLWMSRQNRTFRLHGLDGFHTLVYEVTKDPAMLEFLDGRRNTKNRPNENYGREVMELFVLGVSDLNGVDNYTQTDVEQIARCLTGYVITDDEGVFDATRFDNGSKTLFDGTTYEANGNIGVEDASGVLLPPAQNVIDILFTHRDSDGALTMPRFLARKLWEWFAYPHPTKTRIDEIAAPFIAGGFVIRDLLRAIFLHDDFYSVEAKTQTVRNPCEYAFGAIRRLRATTNGAPLPEHLTAMGMELFNPPGVNGWNQGQAWVSTGQFLARFEFAQALAAGRSGSLKLSPTRLYDRTATDASVVVDGILAKLQIASQVPADVRQELVDYFEGATNFNDDTVIEKKVRGAVALMLDLPESQVH